MNEDSHDWLSASQEDRKALYKIIKRVIDTTGLTWDELYAGAIGRHPSRGIGYEDNFRAGKISRSIASRIHRWLAETHPDQAQALGAALRDTDNKETSSHSTVPGARWEQFLKERATGSGVAVRKPTLAPEVEQHRPRIQDSADGSEGMYRRVFADAYNPSNPLARVRLGEPFYFLFQTSAVGTVITLSEHRHQWIPERMAENGDAPIFTDGENVIPSLSGEPRPLIEYDDGGLHRFLFIVLDGIGPLRHLPNAGMGQALPLRDLDELAHELSGLPIESVRVFLVSILFS